MMKYFEKSAIIRHGIDTKDAPYVVGEPFYVGKFVDRENQPTYTDMLAKIKEKASK